MLTVGLILGGFVVLTLGAELLVRGASRLAVDVGVSPLVIGLTVVAYGTSTPELAVSISAAMKGNANIAVANVVGSNIFNTLFILGLCALILPLTVSRQLVTRDVPIMIGVSALCALFVRDGRLDRVEAAVLVVGLITYTTWTIIAGRREHAKVYDAYAEEFGRHQPRLNKLLDMTCQILFIVAGLALLALGSRWLIDGAIHVAQWLGVSDTVIGLTVVAAGTSLPEVATSVLATLRKQRDIAIGNVVGSNIYNIIAILGLSGIALPGGLQVAPEMVALDVPFMLLVSALCLPIFYTGYTISRGEGLFFFGGYLAYTTYLVLHATAHDFHAGAQKLLFLVASLGVIMFTTLAVRSFHARRKA